MFSKSTHKVPLLLTWKHKPRMLINTTCLRGGTFLDQAAALFRWHLQNRIRELEAICKNNLKQKYVP